jgi:hypothetical protein
MLTLIRGNALTKHIESQGSAKKHDKGLFQRPVFLFLSFIIFCVLFVTIFYLGKASAIKDYNAANNAVPSIRNFGANPQVLDIFSTFGALFGVGLGILMLVSLYIWYGIASVSRLTKHKMTVPILLLVVYGFWFLVGLKLAFFEDGYTPWANGVIYFTGRQLFYATSALIICAAVLLFLPGKRGGKDA